MTDYVTQDRLILYTQADGPGTAMAPIAVGKTGMTGKTSPGPARNAVFGSDVFGRPVLKLSSLGPPGGINTATIEEDDVGTISFLYKQYKQVGCFPVQERYVECGRLDTTTQWNRIKHRGRITITQLSEGDGPSREFNGDIVFNTYDVSWPYTVVLLKHALTSLTVGEDQNINDIAVLDDLIVGCQDCFPGYTVDQIMYVAPDANTGSAGDFANVWYSTNGGSTWAITSTNPFATGSHVREIEIAFISDTQFRVVVADDSNSVKYSDFTLGDEGTSSWSAGVSVGTTIEDMKWLFYDRLYVAADGDIYISSDQAVSFDSATYTGTAVINDMARNYDGDEVYAVGASNTILRERNKSGTFDALVGPSGGGTFYSVFIANDDRLYAGNGQSIYVSTNKALNAGGWTSLKDFGSNKTVVKINCAGGSTAQGGDSQLIRAVVDDTAGSTGEVWESEDGGNTWRQITSLTNTGYNEAFFSNVDDNLAFIPGDGGVLQKLSPEA